MITKFKIFEYNELDPYGEENWKDDIFIPITSETILKVNDEIYDPDYEFYGTIKEVFIGDMGRTVFYNIRKKNYNTISRTKDNLKHYEYKVKINNIQESHNEIDPYGENNWDDDDIIDITTAKNIEIGDTIYDDNNVEVGVVENIVILLKSCYYAIVNKDNRKHNYMSYFDLKRFGYKIKKRI